MVLAISISLAILVTVFFAICQPFHSEGDFFDDSILGYLFIICSFFNSLISFTIGFNLYKIIRNNLILSSLSFYAPLFLCPLILFLLESDKKLSLELWLLWGVFSLPFIITQTYYFIRFRMGIKNGEIMDDFYYTSNNEDN